MVGLSTKTVSETKHGDSHHTKIILMQKEKNLCQSSGRSSTSMSKLQNFCFGLATGFYFISLSRSLFSFLAIRDVGSKFVLGGHKFPGTLFWKIGHINFFFTEPSVF